MKLAPILVALLFVAACSKETNENSQPLSCEDGPSDLYRDKVEPLLDPDRPSSCEKCHLQELALSEFVQDDPCASMACLIEQDLVNLEKPTESQILKFIEKGYEEPDTDKIKKKMIDAEYEGFLSWIEYSASCQESACGVIADPCGTGGQNSDAPDMGSEPDLGCQQFCEPPPPLTDENYGCDESELTRAFYDHIFPEHGRCEHCHSPQGALQDLGESENWLWHTPTVYGAGQTIAALDALGAFDYETPLASNVLLKPLDESDGGVEHGGGAKYTGVDDSLYLSFRAWIEFKVQCDTQ